MQFHSKGHTFHLKHCVYFPILVKIFVGTLDSYFLTHRKNITTSIHVRLFKNICMCISKCVFICMHIKLLKQNVSRKYSSGEVCTAKKSWQGGRFLEHWFAGSEARKFLRELEGSTLDQLFASWAF